MIHYQNNTKFVDACRKKGFVNLIWMKNVLDPITGNNTERAELKGKRFEINVILVHPKVSKPENQKNFDDTKFTRVEIFFHYMTELGNISYTHVHEDNPFERAKEYAEWQATLVYEMLINLEQNRFT